MVSFYVDAKENCSYDDSFRPNAKYLKRSDECYFDDELFIRKEVAIRESAPPMIMMTVCHP